MIATQNNINQFLYTPGKYFEIPDFQRPYSWDKANVTSFLDDLEAVLSSGKNHYFGSVVYINEGNKSTIIDGQQRATTVLLMLTAIYHLVLEDPAKASLPAEAIKDNFLFNKYDYSGEQNRIKLRTVTTDNKIFEQIYNQDIDGKKSDIKQYKDSKLYQAYLQFMEYFTGKQNLERYIDGLTHFEIVTLALATGDDDPQKVFESINSTGKPLTDGDKIRNFALMLNDKQAREVVLEKYWSKIEQSLTDINKDYISDFFRNFLTSRLQKEVKVEQVYPEFKKLFYRHIQDVQDLPSVEAFYGTVLSYLNNYLLLKFNDNADGDYSRSIVWRAYRLNFLKIETPYPFLMRLLEDYEHKELDEKSVTTVFDILESYLARRIICNIPTTGLNGLFAILHKEIMGYLKEYPDSNYVDVFKYSLLSRSGSVRYPADAEVNAAIVRNPFYSQRNSYIMFVLSSFDDQSKESALLKQIASKEINISIEHIMPQKLTDSWREMLGERSEEIHDQYLHTLPNLTLTGYNSEYSNKDFNTKKTIENGFNDSPLAINKFIRGTDVWNEQALVKRADWWCKTVKKLWPEIKTTFEPASDETILDLSESNDYTNLTARGLQFLGESYEVKTWADLMERCLRQMFDLEPNLYDAILIDDFLHKYITTNQDSLRQSRQIKNTPYYFEGNIPTNLKRDILLRLLDKLELDKSEIKITTSE